MPSEQTRLSERRKSLVARYMTEPSEWEDIGPLPEDVGPLPEEDGDRGSGVDATVSRRRALPTIVVSAPVLPEFQRPHFILVCRAFLAHHPAVGWCIGAAAVALAIGIWIPQL
jgi:hypothetical protein